MSRGSLSLGEWLLNIKIWLAGASYVRGRMTTRSGHMSDCCGSLIQRAIPQGSAPWRGVCSTMFQRICGPLGRCCDVLEMQAVENPRTCARVLLFEWGEGRRCEFRLPRPDSPSSLAPSEPNLAKAPTAAVCSHRWALLDGSGPLPHVTDFRRANQSLLTCFGSDGCIRCLTPR